MWLVLLLDELLVGFGIGLSGISVFLLCSDLAELPLKDHAPYVIGWAEIMLASGLGYYMAAQGGVLSGLSGQAVDEWLQVEYLDVLRAWATRRRDMLRDASLWRLLPATVLWFSCFLTVLLGLGPISTSPVFAATASGCLVGWGVRRMNVIPAGLRLWLRLRLVNPARSSPIEEVRSLYGQNLPRWLKWIPSGWTCLCSWAVGSLTWGIFLACPFLLFLDPGALDSTVPSFRILLYAVACVLLLPSYAIARLGIHAWDMYRRGIPPALATAARWGWVGIQNLDDPDSADDNEANPRAGFLAEREEHSVDMAPQIASALAREGQLGMDSDLARQRSSTVPRLRGKQEETVQNRLGDPMEWVLRLVEGRLPSAEVETLRELQRRFSFLPSVVSPGKGSEEPGSVSRPIQEFQLKAALIKLAGDALSRKDYGTAQCVTQLELMIWPDNCGPYSMLALCYAQCGNIRQAHECAVLAVRWLKNASVKISRELGVPNPAFSGLGLLSADDILVALADDAALQCNDMADVTGVALRKRAAEVALEFRVLRAQFLAAVGAPSCEGIGLPGREAGIAQDTVANRELVRRTVGFQLFVTWGRVGKMQYIPEDIEPDFYALVLEATFGAREDMELSWSCAQEYEKKADLGDWRAPIGCFSLDVVRALSPDGCQSSVATRSKVLAETAAFFSRCVKLTDRLFGGKPGDGLPLVERPNELPGHPCSGRPRRSAEGEEPVPPEHHIGGTR
jgi:hypothetical protein